MSVVHDSFFVTRVVIPPSRCRIVDDEVGIPLMNAAGVGGNGDDAFDDDLDNALAAPDELPQIAGVIDERPPEMREVEYSNSDRWARVGGGGGDLGKSAAVRRFLPYLFFSSSFFFPLLLVFRNVSNRL